MNEKIKDAFDSVHAESEMKSGAMAYIRAQTDKAEKRVPVRRMAVAFACFALVLLGLGGRKLYMTPVAAVSVDVNPSVELGVNRFDRIVYVEGYNEDGDAVAAAVDLRNMSYSDGLTALLESEAMRPYVENNGLVTITVIGSTEEKSEQMRALIARSDYAAGPNVECRCGDREAVTAAHEAGFSFGKYQAFLELQALDPELTPADAQGMTMRQIRDAITALTGEAPESLPHQGGSGGGQGHGQHHGRS